MLQKFAIVKQVLRSGVLVDVIGASNANCCSSACAVKDAASKSRLTLALLEADIDITVGDKVLLVVPETTLVATAFVLYGMPILGFFGGLALGKYWHFYVNFDLNQDLLLLVFGILGGAVGCYFARRKSKALEVCLLPKITSKVVNDLVVST